MMKTITHAQKKLMLKYFDVLEDELGRALEELADGAPTSDPSFIPAIAARVYEQAVSIAARIPDAVAPSMQQVSKNLEAVLDPAFFSDKNGGDKKGDPVKAVRALKQQLHEQPEYTKPKSGVWDHAHSVRRKKSP